ncbi:cytochrome P450 [Xylaria scruposa]|nr:cytochrome P450 [Xylaria scruposa]
MALFSSTSLALAVLILYVAIGLVRNTFKAINTGLPYTFTLIHELQTWAYVTDPILRRLCRKRLLRGQGWPRWARFMIKDWHYEDKCRAHDEFGSIFLVVSPAGIVCYVADARVALHVLTRRKAFVKPPEKMKMLEPFGPNIGSSEGDLWKSHSRIATPSFNESTLLSVWNESQRQAHRLKTIWSRNNNMAFEKEIYTSTMETMSAVSFGLQGHSANPETIGFEKTPRHTISLLGALNGVVMHLPHILLVPKLILRYSPWKAAYTAYTEMDKYMDDLLSQANRDIDHGIELPRGKGSLLEALHRHSRQSPELSSEKLSVKLSLTDQEIKGNLFIFLLAGYDTTANTIIYACIILSLYPDIQDRVLSEIEQYHRHSHETDVSGESISQQLAKFPYLLALMYEILRVFPVIRPIARQTTSAQQLPTGTHQVVLPGGTDVIVNNTALHFTESNWRSAEVIDPRRWLVQNPNAFDPSIPPTKEQETEMQRSTAKMPEPLKGTFMTFGEGPRACLGRNFAKVEFVAFFSELLHGNRLLLGDTATSEEVERELRFMSGGSPVTLIPPRTVDITFIPTQEPRAN